MPLFSDTSLGSASLPLALAVPIKSSVFSQRQTRLTTLPDSRSDGLVSGETLVCHK